MHDSITDLANDFVISLQDEETAIYIIHQVKNKFGLQGKSKNMTLELFFNFLFIIDYICVDGAESINYLQLTKTVIN